jgi:hypothetical protein
MRGKQLNSLVALVDFLPALPLKVGLDDGIDDLGRAFGLIARERDRNQVGVGYRVDIDGLCQALRSHSITFAPPLPVPSILSELIQRCAGRRVAGDFSDLLLDEPAILFFRTERRRTSVSAAQEGRRYFKGCLCPKLTSAVEKRRRDTYCQNRQYN